ncbi:PAF acetylhydrolase family protein [Lasiodiplodia theobromae]|uniref:PAF acetylhydrolase family protein n=1 Tax=Lasiodiplodia theobromae TaxID=45133 RepID=UPI0015C39701|nr:PAF acetylhydrolase family protein [Lasiodiplodia theobromae]KAF4537797.1 PAF acetylhydrolase family protein [Lasiodiplodia theobromae]
MRSFIFTLAQLAPIVSAISLWDPTGPYHVGYTQHVFNHTTAIDPTPNPGILLLTIYYPTTQAPSSPAPYLDAKAALIYSQIAGISNTSLLRLTTPLQFQAPTLLGTHPSFGNGTSPYPTIIFTPGAGSPVAGYTAYLSELASHGYAVVGIDHPGEMPYLPLPYGAAPVDGIQNILSLTQEQFRQMYRYRVADIAAVLNPDDGGLLPQLIAQYGAPFNTSHYALFGHSMGGAASAGAMIASPGGTLWRAGGNLDGAYQHLLKENATTLEADPNAANPDLRAPFLELASEARFRGLEDAGGAPNDTTWVTFNSNQTGWLRDVQVNGTAHLDYTDFPLWFDLLGERETAGGLAALGGLGGIAGARVTEVVMGLVRGFLGEWVGGGDGVEGVDGFIERTEEAFVLAEN